jgi:hypothetical protein
MIEIIIGHFERASELKTSSIYDQVDDINFWTNVPSNKFFNISHLDHLRRIIRIRKIYIVIKPANFIKVSVRTKPVS